MPTKVAKLDLPRCGWVNMANPAYVSYHDREWGVPVHSDRRHFEFLILESAQAGLSWETILLRRKAYKAAFANFSANQVANFGPKDRKRLLADSGIIRNKLKIDAAIGNARAFLKIKKEFGSFDRYIWRFVDGEPRQNKWRSLAESPVSTPESEKLSRDLKQRGMKFVGPIICYSHMQAVGLVNDHLVSCFRHAQCRALGQSQ